MGYDELRKLYLARLRPVVAEAARASMPARPWFRFVWLEADRHRDPDNVRVGAKLILDALVLGGVLPGDGAAVVGGFATDVFGYGFQPSVGVFAREDLNGPDVWRMDIPFRLPDLNEIIAAARQDGILTERTRQARRGRS